MDMTPWEEKKILESAECTARLISTFHNTLQESSNLDVTQAFALTTIYAEFMFSKYIDEEDDN